MARREVPTHHINPEKTRTAVDHAVQEVRHAVRPERRRGGILSWLVALAAGGTVAWRSFRAARSDEPDGFGTPLPGLEKDPKQQTAGRLEEKDRSPGRTARKAHDRALPADRKQKQPDRPASRNHRDVRTQGGTLEADEEHSEECPAKAEGFGELAKELWCRFQSDECMMRSQALAFIGVLSLGPVLLFALAALGFIIHDPQQVENFVRNLVHQLLPGAQAAKAADNLIAQTHIMESARTLMQGKWWAVTIGVVSLVWAAVNLFVGASDPMNAALDVRETRSFIKLRLVAFGVFIGSGILFLLSLIPSTLPSLIGRVNLPILGALSGYSFWIDLLGFLVALVVDAAMFTVIYRFLPNAHVNWKAALFAGAITGLLWELFKKGFAVYIAHFGNFDKLYGTLGGAVLLVTWIWYSCVVLLVGAILCKMYREHTEEGGVIHQTRSRRADAQTAPAT